MADFAVQRPLGEGATGEVFLAEADGQPVALKFLKKGEFSASAEILRREVKLLSRLAHPNLVKILDFFPSGLSRDRPFFSMEYVPGHSLEDWPGKKDASAVVSVFVQVVEGLRYLHARRILHRDLKPSNLRVTPEGRAKILDFGLSTLDVSDGSVRGTLKYLPPEALAGDYGTAGDLFSLGAVFYEALAGRPASSEPLSKFRPDLPAYFSDLVDRLVERSPSRRPGSALAVLKYLTEHGQGRPAVLQKIPFVGRRAEMEALAAWERRAVQTNAPVIARVSGPAGVGRSRFLEEAKWDFQIQGATALSVTPAHAGDWRRRIAERLGFSEKS
ncbi:MAG TPA: serine/threonine-protein kinase, partial [bacterium]|nr:serine/threonine-protein kinase [bacterium]